MEFATCLADLSRSGCLQRLADPGVAAVPAYPVYALVSRNLPQRRSRLEARLRELGGADVTLVSCADRQDIEALDAARRRCLHPEYVATKRWGHPATGLSNGTLSLALKQHCSGDRAARSSLRPVAPPRARALG